MAANFATCPKNGVTIQEEPGSGLQRQWGQALGQEGTPMRACDPEQEAQGSEEAQGSRLENPQNRLKCAI